MCCRTNGSCPQIPLNIGGETSKAASHLLSKTLIWNLCQSCSHTYAHTGLSSTIPSRSPLSVSGRGGISCLEQEQKVAQDDCSFLLWHAHRAPAGSRH